MREFGPPEVLRYEDVPTPAAGPGEVLVRVGAVSVNRTFDLLVRKDGNNRGPVLPLVLGADMAGAIVEVGDRVADFRVGDRVAVWRSTPCGECTYCKNGDPDGCMRRRMVGIHRWGGYADFAALPVEVLTRVPDQLSLPDATVILRHGPTAYALADRRAGLKAGQTALVMGAAGGLGTALVQVAKRFGATVIAGAGSDDRVQAALDLGADFGVNYRAADLADEVLKLTNGRGVDVVFENISDPVLWPRAFESLAYEGKLVTIGSHGGGTVQLNARRLYGRHLSVLGGVTVEPEDVQRALDEGCAGHLKAVIGATLPLEQACQAHHLVAESRVVGKVVLVPEHPAE